METVLGLDDLDWGCCSFLLSYFVDIRFKWDGRISSILVRVFACCVRLMCSDEQFFSIKSYIIGSSTQQQCSPTVSGSTVVTAQAWEVEQSELLELLTMDCALLIFWSDIIRCERACYAFMLGCKNVSYPLSFCWDCGVFEYLAPKL